MSFFKSVKKAFRKVYNETSKSTSKLGKVLRYIPGTAEIYATRDAWRKVKNRYKMTGANGSNVSGYNYRANSAGSLYGATGSIVGKY